jgi:ubiquinone/menaquinone biosynthesis C-methylase UbiE
MFIRMRVDYEVLAENYDDSRSTLFRSGGVWQRAFIERLSLSRGQLLLDAGCGTGQLTLPIAGATGATTFGCDPSSGMIEQAVGKPGARRTFWIRGEIGTLPFASDAFDAVIVSLVIQHVPDWRAGVDDLARVTRRDGRIVIRTVDHDAIASHLMFDFFPEGRDIDLARFPSVVEIMQHFAQNGADVISDVVEMQVSYNGEQFLDKLRARYVSTLALLPDDVFEDGIKRAETFVRELGSDTVHYTLRHTYITATVS